VRFFESNIFHALPNTLLYFISHQKLFQIKTQKTLFKTINKHTLILPFCAF
jgi:hypothetical protein